MIRSKRWPCYFFETDTSGEKNFEEFFTDKEILDLLRFENIGIIKNESNFSSSQLEDFIMEINDIRSQKTWEKDAIVDLFNRMIPDFCHKETGKYLDGRM